MNELTESEIAAMCSDDIGEFAMIEDGKLWLVAKGGEVFWYTKTDLAYWYGNIVHA